MRTRLRSKVTLLFIVCAALLAFGGTAMAITADPSGTTAPAPTIQSDKADYAPGELVTLTGSGWKAGESVNIKVNDTYGASWSRNVNVSADASGNITDSFNLPDWFVSDYDVTATGAQSGTVTTSFTDANPNALVVNPTSVTVIQGNAADYSVQVQMGGNATLCTTTLSASGLPTGASATFSGANPRTGNTNYTSTMSVSTTGVSPGTYNFNVNMTRGSNCQGMGNLSTPATLTVNSAVTATSVSDITATDSTFGGTTDLSAKVSPAGAPGSVEFFVNGSSTPASGTVDYNQSTGVATLSNYSHGLDASNTAYSVKAVFTPTSGSNYSSSNATNASALTVGKASSDVQVTCTAGAPYTYTGDPITPCTAHATGAGGLNETLSVTYDHNTNAGTANASASYAGDDNHNGDTGSATFTINKVTPSITWSNPAAVDAGTVLSSTQLNAVVNGVDNNVLAGTSVYNPAAGTVLNAGTQTLKVVFTPSAANAGNYTTASKEVQISVSPNNFGTGFFQPVDNRILNGVKGGSTVPMKFEIFQTLSGTELKSTSAIKTWSTTKVNCTTVAATGEDAIEEYTTGNTSLRFDTTGDQFILNWQAPKASQSAPVGTCYRVTIVASDGSTPNNVLTALYKIR